MAPKLLSLLLITLPAVSSASATAVSIGVNYGTLADNLPPPSQVTAFLKSRTFIDRIKLFNCNSDFIRAFTSIGISVTITAPNDTIPPLATPVGASSWIKSNVFPRPRRQEPHCPPRICHALRQVRPLLRQPPLDLRLHPSFPQHPLRL